MSVLHLLSTILPYLEDQLTLLHEYIEPFTKHTMNMPNLTHAALQKDSSGTRKRI